MGGTELAVLLIKGDLLNLYQQERKLKSRLYQGKSKNVFV